MRNTCYHLIDVGKAFDKIQYPVLFKNKNKVKNNSHTRNSRELLKSDKGQIFFFSAYLTSNNVKNWVIFSLHWEEKNVCSHLYLILFRGFQTEKEIKGLKIKLVLFADNLIVYIEPPPKKKNLQATGTNKWIQQICRRQGSLACCSPRGLNKLETT